MGAEPHVNLEALRVRGMVRADDVLRLRRAWSDDGAISLHEAEALFAINRACADQDDAFAVLFVEVLTDFIVRQTQPDGYVTAANASWLVDQIAEDGVVDSRTELELLVKVLEEARYVPESLTAYAMCQVKRAVISGTGPLRDGGPLEPGVVTKSEVDLLRRILYAVGSEGNIAITRTEAEILFDINDSTDEMRNHPAWSDLFVKAIANHLMAATGHASPSREEALRLEKWVESRDGVDGFFAKMLGAGLSGVWGAYRETSWEEQALERVERQRLAMITAEPVTAPEAEWLADRIGRDGKLHENEKALLSFLKAECPEIHPSLKPLLARV